MYVIAVGDAFNGVTLYGPFPSYCDALRWAEDRWPHNFRIVQVRKTEED